VNGVSSVSMARVWFDRFGAAGVAATGGMAVGMAISRVSALGVMVVVVDAGLVAVGVVSAEGEGVPEAMVVDAGVDLK
jgi:hypothetical protein